MVTIPRDTLVARPACTAAKGGGTAPGASSAMFNTAYEVGGPACAVKTVEPMTGLRMDHYIEVDFTGFTKLIDALGGVTVTTTEAIDDPRQPSAPAAGTHTLDGEQALGLVRTRHGVGDGSDLGRIQLQQALMKALMEQVEGVGVLSNPTKLCDIADTATKAHHHRLRARLGQRADGLRRGASRDSAPTTSQMVTMPVQYDPATPTGCVAAGRPPGQPVCGRALAADQPIPRRGRPGSPRPTGATRGDVASDPSAGRPSGRPDRPLTAPERDRGAGNSR